MSERGWLAVIHIRQVAGLRRYRFVSFVHAVIGTSAYGCNREVTVNSGFTVHMTG